MPKTAPLYRSAYADGVTTPKDVLEFHREFFGDARMEDGPAGPPTAADTGAAAGQDAPAVPAAPDAPADAPVWNPSAWDGKVDTLPPDAQKMINDLRKEAGDERVAKKTLDAIMAALNPDSTEKPDPTKLASDLTAAQQAQRQTAIELAVYRAAGQHQGNPDALLDSRSFLAKVADFDPSADDFGGKVAAAIKEAVDANPTLKTARAAGASSVDAGGSGETKKAPASLADAINQHYGA